MALHVMAGHQSLLRPVLPEGAALAAMIASNVHSARAAWLDRGLGADEHDFLLADADDARVAVFARSLRDSFGERNEPLVTLADLLDAPENSPPGRRSPADVLEEIWSHRPAAAMVLHAVTLPEAIDGGAGWAAAAGFAPARVRARLDALRTRIGGDGAAAGRIDTRLHVVAPGAPGFTGFLNNAIAAPVAARAALRLAECGLAAEPPRLAAAVAQALARWSLAGIAPAHPVDAARLDQLAARAVPALLEAREPVDA